MRKKKGTPADTVNDECPTLEEAIKRKSHVVGWAEKGIPHEDGKNLRTKIGE